MRSVWRVFGGVLAVCLLGCGSSSVKPADRAGDRVEARPLSDRLAVRTTERGVVATGPMIAFGRHFPWRSPAIEVEPFQYVRLDLEMLGGGFVGVYSVNGAATFGRSPASVRMPGRLVADDWTRFDAEENAGWAWRTYYSRARCNAQAVGVEIAYGRARRLGLRRADRAEVARWYDRLYAAMPPIAYRPSPDRFARLRRVHARLRRGQDVKIVLVGDSIMNDTGNGGLDVMLERAWGYDLSEGEARPRVRLVTAVGSGAGMHHWSDDTSGGARGRDLNLAQGVLARKPDLVILGGISTWGPSRVWMELIDKVRLGVEGRYGYWPDVMVMTGPFGSADRRPEEAAAADRLARRAAAVRKIADERHAAFFDLKGAAEAYFDRYRADGGELRDLYRDRVHANHFGKQLLARLMLARLSPQAGDGRPDGRH